MSSALYKEYAMQYVFVLIETHKGVSFCVTASTSISPVLRKAKLLIKKAEARGELASTLSPKEEGDLTREQRQKRGFEYSIQVFENTTGRPMPCFRISKAATTRWLLSLLAKSEPLPYFR